MRQNHETVSKRRKCRPTVIYHSSIYWQWATRWHNTWQDHRLKGEITVNYSETLITVNPLYWFLILSQICKIQSFKMKIQNIFSKEYQTIQSEKSSRNDLFFVSDNFDYDSLKLSLMPKAFPRSSIWIPEAKTSKTFPGSRKPKSKTSKCNNRIT